MDGRDIGTVVFPDADVKLFLTASAEERAKRRWLELQAKGFRQSLEEIRRSLEERDRRDAERAVSPLRKADDAVEIDTTDKSVDEVVRLVLDIVRKEQCTCSTK
jgi:Cytidylate kinase